MKSQRLQRATRTDDEQNARIVALPAGVRSRMRLIPALRDVGRVLGRRDALAGAVLSGRMTCRACEPALTGKR